MNLGLEAGSRAALMSLSVDTAGTQSGVVDSFPGPAQLLLGTVAAVAGPELGPVTGLQTVLLPELVKMRGVAGKEVVSAEVPGS